MLVKAELVTLLGTRLQQAFGGGEKVTIGALADEIIALSKKEVIIKCCPGYLLDGEPESRRKPCGRPIEPESESSGLCGQCYSIWYWSW